MLVLVNNFLVGLKNKLWNKFMFIINKNAIGLVKIDKIVKRLIVKNNNKIKISIKIKR